MNLPRQAAHRVAADPPAWLTALRADRAAAAHGVRWLDADEIRANAPDEYDPETYPDTFSGIWHPDASVAHCREHEPHMVLIGRGPEATESGSPVPPVGHWYVDSRQPERLLFAPGLGYPSYLWIPVPGTAEGMARAVAGFFPDPPPSRADLPKVVRGFAGYVGDVYLPNVYSGEPGPIDGLELDRYFTMNTFVGGPSWGSAVLDDPYLPAARNGAGMLALGLLGRQARRQHDGVPSLTFRTAHTRSYLSFEAHRGSLYVIEVRYRPSPHHDVVAGLNELLKTRLPVDLPVDVAGALINLLFVPAEELAAGLTAAADPGDRLGYLAVLAALDYGDLDGAARLREHLADPDPAYRAGVARLAFEYNLQFLVEQAALVEGDAELLAYLQETLDGGVVRAHPNVFEGEGVDEEFDDREFDGDDDD